MDALDGAKLYCGAILGESCIATGGDTNDACVLYTDGIQRPSRLRGHSDYINAVCAIATPPAGSKQDQWRVLTASADETIRVWDAAKAPGDGVLWRHVGIYDKHCGPVRSVCFMDDNGLCAASAGGHDDLKVRIWRTDGLTKRVGGSMLSACGAIVSSRRRPGALSGHTAPVESVCAVTPTLVASASLDETCRLWDAETSREVATLRGHRREALCVCAAYPMLVSSSDDRTVRCWDCRSAATTHIFRGVHSGSIYAAQLDGEHRVVSGGADGRLAAWDLRRAASGGETSCSGGADAIGARSSPLAVKESAHGIRACNKILATDRPVSVGGAEAARLWSFGDDGCVRSWRLGGGAEGFVELTPHNGEAMACLGR